MHTYHVCDVIHVPSHCALLPTVLVASKWLLVVSQGSLHSIWKEVLRKGSYLENLLTKCGPLSTSAKAPWSAVPSMVWGARKWDSPGTILYSPLPSPAQSRVSLSHTWEQEFEWALCLERLPFLLRFPPCHSPLASPEDTAQLTNTLLPAKREKMGAFFGLRKTKTEAKSPETFPGTHSFERNYTVT